MKLKISWLLLPLFLLSCSKKPAGSNERLKAPSLPTRNSLPFEVTTVESAETKEIRDLKSHAAVLLDAKNFDELDALAKTLRDSKECYADGLWKLSHFYDGLNLPVEATDSEWTKHLGLLKDWIKAKPPSITPRVALADGLINYGWKARGGGYADTVTDENLKLLFQRLNEAVTVLNHAVSLKESCPRWWAAMLNAELGLEVPRPKYDATFGAAIKAWPDYTSFYFFRAHFLLPRWYGVEGELEKDLEKSTDGIGGEEGDIVYAQVVWRLHRTVVDATNILREYNLSWERTAKGIDAIERRYPGSLAVKNEAAHLAMLAHDGPAAKKYFDQTEGKIDLSEWPSADVYIDAAHLVYGEGQ